jgi:hypothetical protein
MIHYGTGKTRLSKIGVGKIQSRVASRRNKKSAVVERGIGRKLG